MQNEPIIRSIMGDFARRTGLTETARPPARYLWTDAYAVCNYLELFRQSADAQDLQLALDLVAQVHRTLGRYSENDSRRGWISGLEEHEGDQHPTLGGLRIGKRLNERRRDEPFDERLEWDRDGQYFHYLTKWMHALDAVAWATDDPTYHRWALELAKAAHAGFTRAAPTPGRPRMVWKMSVDLSYPLVDSMGQHDPLDGLITYQQLQTTSQHWADTPEALRLDNEIAQMRALCQGMHWASEDPLGIGGLLADACRLTQLIAGGLADEADRLVSLIRDAQISLQHYAHHHALYAPAAYRLAFRELGLSIGLQAIPRMQQVIAQHPDRFVDRDELLARLVELVEYVLLHETIERFWVKPASQNTLPWREHLEINSVMLATSLAPQGYLILPHHRPRVMAQE